MTCEEGRRFASRLVMRGGFFACETAAGVLDESMMVMRGCGFLDIRLKCRVMLNDAETRNKQGLKASFASAIGIEGSLSLSYQPIAAVHPTLFFATPQAAVSSPTSPATPNAKAAVSPEAVPAKDRVAVQASAVLASAWTVGSD